MFPARFAVKHTTATRMGTAIFRLIWLLRIIFGKLPKNILTFTTC